VVVEGNNPGGPSSLLATPDAGARWRRLADPCGALIVDQLITSTPKGWLLYCYLDGGMSQGTGGLFSSTNAGVSWSIVAKGTEQGTDVGNIGDVMLALALSNNKKIIFAGIDSPGGGIDYSTNVGVHWNRVNEPIESGGSPETISTFGPTGAILNVGNGVLYRTRNGVSWRALPLLTAGSYRGVRICTLKRDTTATIGATEPGIPGTTLNIGVIFRNESSEPCYLDGQPNFTAEEGAARSHVVASTQQNPSGEAPYVILKAHGGAATVWFEVEETKSYGKSYCASKTFNEVSIRFASPSAFLLSVGKHVACTGVPTLMVSIVTAGVDTYSQQYDG
jgi:hypothetical protein